MKKISAVVIFLVLLAGCIAHVTPEGTYLEPIPLSVVLGPPVIIEPLHHIALSPLPPIMVVPDRHIYHYNNLYYYNWDNSWYYGERDRGPWHKLPREYYPKKYRERGKGRDHRDGERERDYRDRY